MVHCAGEGIRGQSEHHHVSSPSPPTPRLTPKLVFLHLWFLFLCCLNPHLPAPPDLSHCTPVLATPTPHTQEPGDPRPFSILTVPIARGRAW